MSKTILVVDDSRTVRQQVIFTIKKAGYMTLEADDGDVGLTVLKENPEIALITSDVNMRRMSGIEMLQEIHEKPEYSKPPVVMLTTEGSAEFIASAKQFGAKAWLVKPFEPTALVSVIKKLIE